MQQLNAMQTKEIRPGYFGKMVHGEKGTLSFWEIKKGSTLEEHHHFHEQITRILEGSLQMKVGGKKLLLTDGMEHLIPSHIPHGAVALTDCKVIDSFAPPRDTYK